MNFLIIPTICFLFSAFYCYGEDVSSVKLINNTKEYDGKSVTYRGEVVGDIMARGDYVWLNVNDGYIAIGVWAPKSAVSDIQRSGDYNGSGDGVEVKGIFNRSCREHGGDLDIHCQFLSKISSGKTAFKLIDTKKIYIASFLSFFVLLTGILKKIIHRRKCVR